MPKPNLHHALVWLALYAIAMACVEAALVVYLRMLYYPDTPLAIFPLRLLSDAHFVMELTRELSTALMILSVAWLAERDVARRFAAFVFVFGLWDIFYYAWLKLFIGWPVTLAEWDVLFLVPWPWFGPWLAPVAIALVFVLWGGWVLATARTPHWSAGRIALFLTGALLALAAFLAPGAMLLPQGIDGFRGYVPGAFPWWLFLPGVVTMTTALITTRRAEASHLHL